MIIYFKEILLLLVLFLCLIIYILYEIQSVPETNISQSGFKVLNTIEDYLQFQHKNSTLFDSSSIFQHKLRYLLNPAPCGQNTWLVILVTSYFGHVEVRSAMRRTQNTDELYARGIRRVFLLGSVKEDKFTSQSAIDDESNKFNDLLQGNFVEAYRNLTFKHVMGLKWASEYCSKVKYVIKMDDDIVFNDLILLNELKSGKLFQKFNKVRLKSRKNYLLAGYVLKNMLPKRIEANKWFVSKEEYDLDYYPDFLSGWFYVTNPHTCKMLVLASKLHKYFWIDDTYVTGILAKFLKIEHVNLNDLYAVHYEYMQCCLNDFISHQLDCPFLIGPNGGDNNLFFNFNKIYSKKCLNDGNELVCLKRTKSINETCVATKEVHLDRGLSEVELYKL